jgi:hypothetical protein
MLRLTPRTIETLTIAPGEPVEQPRDGLLIPVTVDDAVIALSMLRPDHLAAWPHLIEINGVVYDCAWWANRDGNSHAFPTTQGWKNRSLRLQRRGSMATRDYTPAAFRLGAQLMDALIDVVVADPALIERATLVQARRELTAAEREYERAYQELENAEERLRGAEGWLAVLEGTLTSPTAEPVAPASVLEALPAGE